jgi:hypothetical protein
MTPGMSAMQFQRQLGLSRYETAFQILHKLRAGMVRQDRDRIGGNLSRNDHVEVDETYIGGVTRGEGNGVHADDKTLVVAKKGDKPMRRARRDFQPMRRARRDFQPMRRARRDFQPMRRARGAKSLTAFVEQAVEPGAMVITDAWGGYNGLAAPG